MNPEAFLTQLTTDMAKDEHYQALKEVVLQHFKHPLAERTIDSIFKQGYVRGSQAALLTLIPEMTNGNPSDTHP